MYTYKKKKPTNTSKQRCQQTSNSSFLLLRLFGEGIYIEWELLSYAPANTRLTVRTEKCTISHLAYYSGLDPPPRKQQIFFFFLFLLFGKQKSLPHHPQIMLALTNLYSDILCFLLLTAFLAFQRLSLKIYLLPTNPSSLVRKTKLNKDVCLHVIEWLLDLLSILAGKSDTCLE